MDKALKLSWLVIASCLLLGAQQGVQMVIMTGPPGAVGPVGLLNGWPGNDGSGTTMVDTVASNPTNLPQNGSPGAWGAVSGWPATPFTFNATDGFGLSSGGTPNYLMTGTTAFSVCSWIRATSFGANNVIVSNSNPNGNNRGWELGTVSGKAYMFLDSVDPSNKLQVTATGTISTATNTQVCFTYTGNQNVSGVLLYVNGSTVSTTTVVNGLTTTIASGFLGLGIRFNSIGADQAPFNGTVGYASVWNCVLTGGVISTNNAAGPSFTGLHC